MLGLHPQINRLLLIGILSISIYGFWMAKNMVGVVGLVGGAIGCGPEAYSSILTVMPVGFKGFIMSLF